MAESKIKICGKDYDIWATSAEVEALNNQGNAALGKELSSGKQSIVDAINAKGGTASSDESLSELADDVLEIPVNVQVEDAANLAFPESIAWNILKEAYAQQRVGYASWIVAEFFKGYDTIPLSGADAFYTCDGDFYTSATTHTWHDDEYNKVNRFVVYYFVGENVPFSVTQESICPRSMAVIGKFGSINIASAGRIRQIYNGGEINDISFASTNPWCDEVLLAGVKEHNSGYLLYNNNNVQMFASDIEVLNGGTLMYGNNTALTTAIFPKLKIINTNGYIAYYEGQSQMANLKTISFPELIELNGDLGAKNNVSATFANTNLDMPNLEVVNNGIIFNFFTNVNTSFDTFELPKLREINNTGYVGLFSGSTNYNYFGTIHTLRFPSLIKGATYIANGYFQSYFNNLTLLEIGEGYNENFNLRYFGFINSIRTDDNSLVDEGETFANNREKFLYNFEKYIVDKLADNSTTGLSFTLTLISTVYAIVSATQSITDKLTAKHWNLASA